MNEFEAAKKSAEEIWDHSLERYEFFEAFGKVSSSIKCMILEEWAKIIRENFDK